MAAGDVQLICEIELSKLKKKLQKDLKRDIARIHADSLFCDLELVLGNISIHANCCVLQARANTLYNQLCDLQKSYSNGYELDVLTVDRVHNFVKEVYEQDDIRPAETLVVKLLRGLAQSPESDQYVTPLASPVDTLAIERGFVSKPDSSYYSIVPLDWEKELAEQDFLIESFCSILRRDQTKLKRKPQQLVSLTYPNCRRDQESRSLLDLKRALEEDSLLLKEEGSACCRNTLFLSHSSNTSVETKLPKVKCSIIHHNNVGLGLIETGHECGFFDAEDFSSPFNNSLNGMQREIWEKIKMSSNIDAGPDSGLATSAEDIPVDQESGLEICKSVSSSVSSDCCVWESSSAPPQNQHNLNTWVESAPYQDNLNIQPDFVDCVLEELVGKSQLLKQDDDDIGITSESSNGASAIPKHNFFIDASSLLDDTEVHMMASVEATQELHGKKSTGAESTTGETPFLQCCLDRTERFVINEAYMGPESGKPPSLIRSNTFELETEDDRLAVLRHEYERRQGNQLFERCGSQSSGPLSDAGQDLNQHCTSLILSDVDSSVPIASLFPTHVVDDEIQTPDSLNSDFPEICAGKLHGSNAEDTQATAVNEHKVVVDAGNGDIDCVSAELKSLTLNELSSPLFARRKTESTPILSGAAPLLLPEPKADKKSVRLPNTASLSSAWVVDIRDMTNSPESRRKKGDSLSMEVQEDLPSSEPRSLSSSLGYYIDLNNPTKSMNVKHDGISCSDGSRASSRQLSYSAKSDKQNACEFFVDLKHPIHHLTDEQKNSDESGCSEKKLFSMFIDFGDKVRPKAKPALTSKTRSPLSPFSKKKNLILGTSLQSEGINGKSSDREAEENQNDGDSASNSTFQAKLPTHCSDPKKSFFMFIESESTLCDQRAPLSSRAVVGNSCLNGKEKTKSKAQHVRAHSVSLVNRSLSNSASSAVLPLKHLSSQSLQNSEIFSDINESREKSMFSSYHVSLPLESNDLKYTSQDNMVGASEIPSRITIGSNESSACSLDTYSVHTPDQSSATDDYSSEKREWPPSSDLLKDTEVHGNVRHKRDRVLHDVAKRKISSTSENNLNVENVGPKSFVRLSDLDKEPTTMSAQPVPSVSHWMSRSIPETSWLERKSLMSQSTGGGSAVMSSSSRSLSRLFPHLSMCSGSVKGSKTSSTCSPLTEDFDTMRSSQVSDMSSMQSSAGLEYSTESTDISSNRGSPATQLGDDLLRMFLEEISTDVIVEIGGRRIKAHKCILSSRCQYFAAILSGGWVESAGNVISLQGFSYTVVHFALCHIYSGASTIPDQISIVELASLADMLSLEGLKDVIMHTIKVKYCHFFHKPCAVCSVGVLECLPLAAAYGLDDIYRKSLRWITKFFIRIWPTKTFTTLPRELIEKCYQQHVIHMTTENVLETILCCDKLISTIPTVRWAEPVFVLTSRLMETCIKFMSENFCALVASDNFLALGREVPWNVSRFQESLVSACDRMPPDQSCRSYSQLCSVLDVVQGPDPPPEMIWHPNFIELLIQLRDLAERTLIKQAARASRTPGWGQMPLELRRKIQDAACLVLAPADHASSRYKRIPSDHSRQNSQCTSYSRNLDLHQVKMAMEQHARRTNYSDHHIGSSVVTRKSITSDRSNTISRRSAPITYTKATDKSASVSSQGRPKTWPAQVKSRYLEKRPSHSKQTVQERNKHLDAPVPQRKVPAPVKGMFISSSDSSRNSSPAMKRSTNMSCNVKVTDSTSRTRAATVTVSNSSRVSAPGGLKEENFSKSTESIARRSLGVNVKSQSLAESLRKGKDAVIPSDFQTKQEDVKSQTPSMSQSITMSNDSLATVSSSDDNQRSHFGKNKRSRCPMVSKCNTSQNTGNELKKSEVKNQLTPLGLAHKKTSIVTVQNKKTPVASKLLERKAPVSPLGLLSKNNISQVSKSPNTSTVSRLAIPLRTSRSVPSVPDNVKVKAHSLSESLSSRRTSGKDNCRSNVAAPIPKRDGLGSSTFMNLSLAGRALSSRGNKTNVNERKFMKCRDSEKVNGDSNLGGVVHPTVGPRSGTFLKDEPTVLKTPVVEDI